jgi:threonylcarbamoyladenosine tRNA methylthiotransferase CDKAL1
MELIKTGKDFSVRVGMMNPTHIREFLDELVSVYSSKQIFKFLHIPVQSGNDEILRGMNRDYRVADFVEIVRKFREKIPEITLATDIICGYPGESKEQFNDSVNLVKEVKPDVLNISRFWPRPGTAAASMEQVSGEETKERSRFLTSVFEYVAYENNRKWRGWEGRVVIDEHGKNGTWVGRNYAYKPVVLEGDYQLGEVVSVRIAGVAIHDLRGIEI